MFELEWDTHALQVISHLTHPSTHVDRFLSGLANRLGHESVDHIRPLTESRAWRDSSYRAKSIPQGTGALRNSIAYQAMTNPGGFEVTFWGLWYGNLVDEGNFPASSTRSRSGGRAFPVGKRAGGPITYSKTIHGMGHLTKTMPTHFSAETVTWLDGSMHSLADGQMQHLLNELVS